ncbi:MAG TPA: hypothetical protein VG944_20350 [Fimbriimonas sp.]|nr:hypothetical protein [Fimbriimonas sp.]
MPSARITATLDAKASGLIPLEEKVKLLDITIPNTSAAELEAAGAVAHLPGEDPSKGVLLSATETKVVWIEKLWANVEVDVLDVP